MVKTPKGWKKISTLGWVNDTSDERIVVDFVEFVSDDLHWVVSRKSPSFMEMKIKEEKSFGNKEQAIKFAFKFMRTHPNG